MKSACVLLAAVAWARVAVGQNLEPARDHSFLESYEDDDPVQKVFDDEVLQALRTQLGGLADNVMVVVSACSSAGFAAEGTARLTGNWSVSASRSMKFQEHNWYNDQATKNGKNGLKVSNDEYAHGWGPQFIRAIKTDTTGTRTAKTLHNFAVASDYEVGGGATFTSGGTGQDAKLRVNGAKNRVAYWQTFCESNDMVKTARETYTAAGFAAGDIDLAYNDGANDIGTTVDRKASRAALLGPTGMIVKLKTELTGGTQQKRALLMLWAHGNRERRAAPKAPAAVPSTPKQGKEVTPTSSPTSIAVDSDFAADFFADLVDDPGISRASNPSLLLSTAEENFPGPTAVDVYVDSVQVGTIVFPGSSSTGGYHDLELSDQAWADLQPEFSDGRLDVSFAFANGSFRIATEWDFDLEGLRHYGIGLAGPAIRGTGSGSSPEAIPALGRWGRFILLLGMLLAGTTALARRRAA